jgi:hypothetical protein
VDFDQPVGKPHRPIGEVGELLHVGGRADRPERHRYFVEVAITTVDYTRKGLMLGRRSKNTHSLRVGCMRIALLHRDGS